jgi:hypothetical protein
MLTKKTPPTVAISSRSLIRLIGLFAVLAFAGLEARAVSPCTIGLPNVGTSTPTINGIRSTEWNDASLLTSGDPCFDLLGDMEPRVTRIVKVYSKLFPNNLGFFFEIPDATQSGPCSSGKLCIGDRIVLQFDSNKSRGAALAGGAAGSPTTDLQIVITYKGGDVSTGGVLDLGVKILARDSFCTTPVWDDITASVPMAQMPQIAVRSDQPLPGAGYSAEIRIPLAFLGTPTSDFGIAFAVINDIGSSTCTTSVCDSYAISFPNSLVISNATNPVTPGCSGWGDWIIPDQWGTAVIGPAAAMVTVSRSPDYWSNNGLLVYKCNNTTTPNYQYFDNPPCRATLKANVNNGTGTTQTRNILFLWSPVGAGTPANYNFIELVEHVSLPPGITPVFTQEWNRVPHNQMAHPCVRVYILPDAFLAAFPRSRVITVSNASDAALMESVYNLSTAQWTQKNITEITTRPNCDAGCDSTGALRLPDLMRDRGEVATALPAWPQRLNRETQTTRDDSLPLLPVVFTKVEAPTAAGVLPEPQRDDPPVVTKVGSEILMSPEELRQFRNNNVIVQVRAVGFDKSTSNATPRYNFLENLGGVIQIIPVSVLLQQGSVPFRFNVTNGATEHTIFLLVDVSIPSAVSQAQVALDTERKVYTPAQNRVFKGVVKLPGTSSTPFNHWGLSLHGGLSFPHNNLSAVKFGPNFAIDLEYRFNKTFSLEAIYGFHHFRGKTLGPFTLSNLNVHQFSLNGKVYGSSAPVRPFFNFGGGAYVFTPGVSTHSGLNVGGGLQFDVKPKIAVEGLYNFHTVFVPGSDRTFSGLQGGVRFRF